MNWSRREFSKLAALQVGAAVQAETGIESPYSPSEGKWRMGFPGRVSQHDVVYLSPPEDPSLGLPIGNGDIGALVWTSANELILAINKCDTWDDNEPGPYKTQEEKITALRHCARLVVDFGSPVFDLLYQKDFQGRVDLATARAALRAVTEFSIVRTEAYLSAGHRVLVLRCETEGTAEPLHPHVRIERWGSRTFSRWYATVNRDASLGLGGTGTSIERGRVIIRQQLRKLSFAVAMQVVADAVPQRLNSRAGQVVPSSPTFTAYVTAVTSENDPDPVAAAHRILDRAVAAGEASVRRAHEDDWREFWSASMVDLPEKYLENIWHLTLYFANSSSRGAYPPHFCNGLWGFNRDFVPWTSYFHWNMQDYVWPLHAANHAELAAPYFRYRRDSLPHAMEYAAENLKASGAFYSDVAERRGYNALGKETDSNRTPGAQIALDFWRHYSFTRDERFLRESAWAVIREVARFHSATLVKGDDGLFHVRQTSAYEGSPLFDDTVTDLAMVRALFPVALQAGSIMGHDRFELDRWRDQLDHLVPFRLADLTEPEFDRRGGHLIHRGGLNPGAALESRQVFTVGRNQKGEWIRNRFANLTDKMSYYGLPDPELCPVFPAGLIGLGQRDTDLFRAAVTQVRLHPTADVDPDASKPASMEGRGDQCMGWCPYPIVLARLGLSAELAKELVNTVSTWQFYPQGFGHYGPYYVFKPESGNRWGLNHPRDAATRSNFPFPSWPFRHFDNEAMPIVSTAINEMLLQSYDGVIRVFPATPADWDARFELAAQGAFLVSAERRKARTAWVAVTSRAGGECRLAHPWEHESGGIVCLDLTARAGPVNAKVDRAGAEVVLKWDTIAGHRYLLLRHAEELERWKTVEVHPTPRTEPRVLKRARLGRERLF